MPTIKQQIASLEAERQALDSALSSYEERGIYGGPEYDDVIDQLITVEQDIEALQQADEDDQA
jgi:exonuclease VII small subunit